MPRRALPLAAAVLAALTTIGMPAAASTARSVIRIDAHRTIGKVNRLVFGSNLISYQKGGYGDSSPAGTDHGEGVWDPELRRTVPEMAALERQAGISMARWPGGCATHIYEWKREVGPIENRPHERFGLPEFLRHCKDIGAIPLISVAEYRGTAKDAADLVEYLNAPNDGRHPWAARRAADGHRAPWNVIWFEYGNESEHGPHTETPPPGIHPRMTAHEYATNYRKYRAAMRTVDPRIRLGAVIATGFPELNGWAETVLKDIGPSIDFAIHHSYKISYSGEDPAVDVHALFAAGLACADQIQDYYDRMNALFRATVGRKVPIAVTEFNGGFVQEKPTPFRHTLGNALVNAEMLRVFLRPKNNIFTAEFWEFANEYWGAVKGYADLGEPLVKRPQFFPFQLYHDHFGSKLLAATYTGPSYDTDGGYGIAPARGKGGRFHLLGKPLVVDGPWSLSEVRGADHSQANGILTVRFHDAGDLNYYHARLQDPAKPSTWYRLTAQIRTNALTSSSGASYQIGDARGWMATKSCAFTANVTGTHDWTTVTAEYRTLPDTSAIEVQARRLEGGAPVTGAAWFRNVRIQECVPSSYPGVAYLGVDASLSSDGGKIFLIVVNRNQDSPVTASIALSGAKPLKARTWMLTGPSIDATNEQNPDNVSVHAHDMGTVKPGFAVTFPPHSLTAVEVTVAKR